MREYTKGEWSTYQDMETGCVIVSGEKTIALTHGGEVESGSITLKEAKANAKLIAAAPVLLEALESLVESNSIGLYPDLSHWLKAKEAIKKARG